MTTKELMLEFISQRQGDPTDNTFPKIQQILEIKMKENDDEHGAMGEHYVVKCQMIVYRNTSTSPNGGVFEQCEATCLVDTHEFKKFVSKENAIIWL
jgi:hypothetical protein